MSEVIHKIGFGCAGLSALPTLKRANNVLETAYKVGIRFFDTAPLYGNGFSEIILGNFIRDKRKEVTVTTKFGLGTGKMPFIPAVLALPLNYIRKKGKKKRTIQEYATINRPQLLNTRRISKDSIQLSLEKSLLRLKTDYIDNYLLHEAIPSFLDDAALDYLFDLRKKGIIKKMGIAASFVNIEILGHAELLGWDILQYENGPFFNTDSLKEKFPGQVHIYHSTLKYLHLLQSGGSKKEEMAAMLLAQIIINNPNGKILFSSSLQDHISSNMSLVKSYLIQPEIIHEYLSYNYQ